jgi:hypothetical protein
LTSNDVWAVGRHEVGLGYGTLGEHWDGTRWLLSPTADVGTSSELHGVATVATDNVWAVGMFNLSAVLAERWDGTGWFVDSPTPVGVFSDLNGVDGTSPSDVWAVGFYEPTITSSNLTLAYHWNGLQWTRVPTPNGGPGNSYLNDVVALSPTDAWAVGQYLASGGDNLPLAEHWNGTSWTVVDTPQFSGALLLAVAAISSNDVWAVGWRAGAGFVLHWDGTSWTRVPAPSLGVETYLKDVDGTSANDVWAVGYATPNSEDWLTVTLHWDGTRWTKVPHPIPYGPDQYFYGVTATTEGEAWAVGSSLWSGPEETYTQRYSAC